MLLAACGGVLRLTAFGRGRCAAAPARAKPAWSFKGMLAAANSPEGLIWPLQSAFRACGREEACEPENPGADSPRGFAPPAASAQKKPFGLLRSAPAANAQTAFLVPRPACPQLPPARKPTSKKGGFSPFFARWLLGTGWRKPGEPRNPQSAFFPGFLHRRGAGLRPAGRSPEGRKSAPAVKKERGILPPAGGAGVTRLRARQDAPTPERQPTPKNPCACGLGTRTNAPSIQNAGKGVIFALASEPQRNDRSKPAKNCPILDVCGPKLNKTSLFCLILSSKKTTWQN